MILYDASAFFELLKEQKLELDSFLLDLSFYEIGNVIWKHKNILRQISDADTKKIVELLCCWQNVIRLEWEKDFRPIVEITLSENITFYDASYLHFAKKHSMQLLTADKKLYKTAVKKKINCLLIKETTGRSKTNNY